MRLRGGAKKIFEKIIFLRNLFPASSLKRKKLRRVAIIVDGKSGLVYIE